MNRDRGWSCVPRFEQASMDRSRSRGTHLLTLMLACELALLTVLSRNGGMQDLSNP